MIDTMKREDLTRMLVTLWAIWHAKRKAIHEEVYQSPMATVAFVDRFLTNLDAGGVRTSDNPSKVHGTTGRGRWLAPPAGSMKVNVDAAVSKSLAKGAVGVVCRSGDGQFRGASAVVYEGISHPGTLEALACREALDVAEDLLFGPIYVASDCLEVVKGLGSENLGVFGSILKEIKDRSRL
jgi:hypothetical protein